MTYTSKELDAVEPRSMLRLEAEQLNRMLNFEIHGDPRYSGLEIQIFDDDVHGSGMLAFLARAEDGRIDVYHEPGLKLDPDGYAVGGGLGEWSAAARFDPAHFDIGPQGVHLEVGFTDRAGRRVSIRVDDRGGPVRRPARFLAPMGAAIDRPNRLPLVWMSRFDLVRRRGELDVLIDGEPVEIGRLPGGIVHRRRLVKYAADLIVVSVNPDYDGPLASTTVEQDAVDAGGHHAVFRLDRPLSLEDLAEGKTTEGTWTLQLDDLDPLIDGGWRATREGPHVWFDLEVLNGWRPRRLPLLMKVITRVAPIFRRWPTTYRWRAEVDLDTDRVRSRWSRTDGAGADEYEALTSRR